MNRNTILTTAVMIALGSAGVAAAQTGQTPSTQTGQTAEQCAAKATQLKAQIDTSNLADSDRAKLESSLGEAQAADLARCEQIVTRVQRELTAGTKSGVTNPDTGSDYGDQTSATQKDRGGAAGAPAGAAGYEQGHASAQESLPEHPGAADNTTDAASTSDEGYASAQQTMSGEQVQSGDTPQAGSESTDPALVAAAGGARMQSADATPPTDAAAGSSALANMKAADIVDKPVKAQDGKEVGEIDRVVIDRTPQGKGFAVVGVGGVLGLGERKVVVDLDKLELTADGTLHVPAQNKDEVEGFPRYDEAHYQQYQGDLGRLL